MEEQTNEFFEHIQNVSHRVKYKKVDINIILDTSLTKNDLAIYLAILKNVNFDDTFTKITNKDITKITGIAQCKQGISIDKLITKGYIYSRLGDNCIEYIVMGIEDKFIKLPLEYFDGLKSNVKSFVRTLRYLSLSKGNDKLPSFKICNTHTKISREEYRELKKIGVITNDVVLYESLKQRCYKKSMKGIIKLNPTLNHLKGKTLEEQIDGLLGTFDKN